MACLQDIRSRERLQKASSMLDRSPSGLLRGAVRGLVSLEGFGSGRAGVPGLGPSGSDHGEDGLLPEDATIREGETAIRAVARTLDVLEFVGQQGLPVSAAAVSEACGIPRTSLYKLLRTLESRGYVVATPVGWVAGERLVRLRSDSLLLVHALMVFEALDGSGGRLGADDLSERTELPRDLVERILAALAAPGLVVPGDDGRFGLGLRVGSVTSRAGWVERLQLTARPLLVQLRDESRETASLLIDDDGQALYLDQVESHFELRCRGWVGRRVPLEGTSIGEAFADPGCAHIVHDALEEGVTAVCCAVRGLQPQVGVNIIGPTWRLKRAGLERWADVVQSVARQLEVAYSRIPDRAPDLP